MYKHEKMYTGCTSFFYREFRMYKVETTENGRNWFELGFVQRIAHYLHYVTRLCGHKMKDASSTRRSRRLHLWCQLCSVNHDSFSLQSASTGITMGNST